MGCIYRQYGNTEGEERANFRVADQPPETGQWGHWPCWTRTYSSSWAWRQRNPAGE